MFNKKIHILSSIFTVLVTLFFLFPATRPAEATVTTICPLAGGGTFPLFCGSPNASCDVNFMTLSGGMIGHVGQYPEFANPSICDKVEWVLSYTFTSPHTDVGANCNTLGCVYDNSTCQEVQDFSGQTTFFGGDNWPGQPVIIGSVPCGGATEICNNGIDDDGNGLIDAADPACSVQGAAQDFDVQIVAPPATNQTITAGQTVDYNVQIDALNGFVGTVNLANDSLCPNGATCTVNPPSVTFSNASPTTWNADLKIITAPATPPDQYGTGVQGSYAAITHYSNGGILNVSAPIVVTAVSVTPNNGSGTGTTFSEKYNDTAGAGDIAYTYALFNTSLSGYNSCYIVWLKSLNALFLLNDAGDSWGSGGIVGSGGVLSNSQCSLNTGTASVVTSGNDLTMNLPVTFKPAVSGAQQIWMDASGSADSNWQFRGTYTVNSAAATVTISANPGSVASGGSSTVTWSTTNATSCTASGAWSGAKAVNGNEVENNITVTSTYTLNCDGPGGPGSGSVTVTVVAAPINGACGAWATNYPPNTNAYGPGGYCSAGSPSASPAFPSPGNPVSWICNGSGGGLPSGVCTASVAQSTFTLTVIKTIGGSVKSVDNNISCGINCSATYAKNSVVTLNALPDSAYWKFIGWSGDCTGTGACVVTITSPKTVQAKFAPKPFQLIEF